MKAGAVLAAVASALAVLAASPGAGAAGESEEEAATLYVDGGSPGSVCTDVRSDVADGLGTPWCTIAAAVRAAPAGATVLVRRGTYDRVVLSDLEPAAPITIRSHPGERPVVGGMDIRNVDRLVVRDLKFSDGIFAARGSGLQFIGNEVALTPRGRRTSSGFIINQVEGMLIQDNHVHDGRDGVNFDDSIPPSSNVAIVGNHFEDLGNDAVHITSDQHDIVFARNVIEDCGIRADIDPEAHSDAIQAMGPTQNVLVVSNFVSGGRGFLFMVSPRNQDKPDHAHDGLVIANNVLAGRDFGMRLYSTRGATVVNNTVWGTQDSQGTGLSVNNRVGTVNAPTTGFVLANNLLRRLTVNGPAGFAVRDHNLIATGPRAGAHDLAGPPRFLDLAGLDLRLHPSSPGVDAGDASRAPVVDFAGKGRRGAPDVGAFEVGGTTLVGPLAPTAPGAPAVVEGGGWSAAPPAIDAFGVAPGRLSVRSVATPLTDLSGRSSTGPRRGATLGWRTKSTALAFIRIDRRFRGYRRRGTCVRSSGPRGRKTACVGHDHVAYLVRIASPEITSTALTARLGERRLRRGLYTATLSLLDAFGRVSVPKTVLFRVVRPSQLHERR